MGYIGTFGLSAIHKRWANIAGSAIIAGMAFASLGLAIANAGSSSLFTAVTAGAAIASTVPVATTSLPPNRGLDITASVIGVTTALIVTATNVALLGFSMYGVLSSAETSDTSVALGYVSEGLMPSKMQQQLDYPSAEQLACTHPDCVKSLIMTLRTNSRIKESIVEEDLYTMLRTLNTFRCSKWADRLQGITSLLFR